MTPSIQSLLLVSLPYAAIVAFLVGLVWRIRTRRFTITSLSSQMIESRWLAWGTVPFHVGIVLLFAGHLVPLLFPHWWQQFVSNRTALLVIETLGLGAAVLCLIGLLVLFVRRLTSPALLRVSTFADIAVLVVLIVQVALGLGVAVLHRWGAVWSVRTTMPYVASVFTLRPDPALVAGVPMLVTLHLAGAWIVLALIPFTRLVHMLMFPAGYLFRRPQKVVWATGPRAVAPRPATPIREFRPES